MVVKYKLIERPYGDKYVTSSEYLPSLGAEKTVSIIRLLPGRGTGKDAEKEAGAEVNQNGHRGHSGTKSEIIKVLSGEVAYVCTVNGNIMVEHYKAGDQFESINRDGKHYWHNLDNTSQTNAAKLEVTTFKTVMRKD